ncbi:unnamed protein product [Ambrosiozyma monospora]|uniref:Unnamed protein product n=1 Tax=Ambrosiozyma monospora TaxID=43982 RepID=A0ACB5UD92_AMBMO|nr:unnamed protein product [Ambrosiozyma monospora]
MLKQNLVAITRTVLKRKKDVMVAALIPYIVVTNETKNSLNAESNKGDVQVESSQAKRTASEMEADSDNVEIYGFALVKLPYKEDEKLCNTKNLKLVANKNSKPDIIEEFPDEEMLKEMDSLIDSMDLDKLNGEGNKPIIENKYVELNDPETNNESYILHNIEGIA